MIVESRSFGKRLWEAFLTTWPLFAASAVTIAFAWWVYGLASEQVQSSGGQLETRWHQFISGEPNTMGDTLAGFIGSLTLIWVVASVIQQSMELRAQRKEFAEMVAAQENQATQLAKQVEILDFQLAALKQREAKGHLNQIISKIVRDLKDLGNLAHWEVHGKGTSVDAAGKQTLVSSVTKCGMLSLNANDVEDQVTQAIFGVRHFITRITVTKDIMPRHGKKSAARPQVERLVESIDSASELQTSLSKTDSQWLADLELDSLREALVSLLEIDLWDPAGHYGYVVPAP